MLQRRQSDAGLKVMSLFLLLRYLVPLLVCIRFVFCLCKCDVFVCFDMCVFAFFYLGARELSVCGYSVSDAYSSRCSGIMFALLCKC